MKKFERKSRNQADPGTRTGPRARAAQQRQFGDPYQHTQRPARPRPEGYDRGDQRPPGRPAVITLDPDVARVFHDSETVNDVLRTVIRLARYGGGRPPFARPRPGFDRGPGRGERPREWKGPPAAGRPRRPRFDKSE
jgi:hypothetical protein